MDNTLLDDNDPPRIKLCDFGFAKWWIQEPHMSTITGKMIRCGPRLTFFHSPCCCQLLVLVMACESQALTAAKRSLQSAVVVHFFRGVARMQLCICTGCDPVCVMTVAFLCAGTPDYMAPQLLGPKACNQAALYDGTKADIWAAGVMLCVMLIGRFPFEGIEMSNATNLEEVSAHVSGRGCIMVYVVCSCWTVLADS